MTQEHRERTGLQKLAALLTISALTAFAPAAAGGAVAQTAPPRKPVTAQPAAQEPVPRTAPTRKPAAAQPAAPQPIVQEPPAQTETPQRTTATYDDWTVQCDARVGTPPQKVCQMTQETLVQGRNVPFSMVVVPRPANGQPTKLVIQVPVNVSLIADVRLRADDTESGAATPFTRCLPAGCFAEFELKADALAKFRAGDSAGKISFVDGGGRDVAVPLSFKGFGRAYDALVKE